MRSLSVSKFPLVSFDVVTPAMELSFEVAVEFVVSEESDHGVVEEVILIKVHDKLLSVLLDARH